MIEKDVDLQDGFVLDGWLVEPQLGCLTRNAESRQLEPKIMAVLVLLAANQLAVVRKEVFLDTVWSEVNVIDHVLSRAISEIRRAMDDNPRNPRVIQTLPKIGYKLLMRVSAKRRDAAPHFPPHENDHDPARSRQWPGYNPTFAFFLGGALTVTTAIFTIGIASMLGGRHSH